MAICLMLSYTDTLMNTMPRSPYMRQLEKYSNECKFEVKWFDDQRKHDNVLEGLHFCVEYLYDLVLLSCSKWLQSVLQPSRLTDDDM